MIAPGKAAAVLAVVAAVPLSAFAANSADRPNVGLMMADDLGYNDDGKKLALNIAVYAMTQADRNSVPAVGDCPDFRGGFAERKWDCPLHARQRGAAELGILFSSACLTH